MNHSSTKMDEWKVSIMMVGLKQRIHEFNFGRKRSLFLLKISQINNQTFSNMFWVVI